jgi:transmembrane sensor
MADPKKYLDAELLDRYLSGTASPDEIQTVDRWIASDPGASRLVAALRRMPAAAQAVSGDPDTERWSAWLSRAMTVSEGETRAKRRSLWKPFRAHNVWASAAAAVLLIGIGVAGWALRDRISTPKAAVTDPGREYTTAPGQRATIELSDGTQILLNVASTLTVAPNFGATDRVVTLQGEARFSVAHDSARPFIVRTKGMTAQDLGTVFGVRAYANEDAQVGVAEGAVRVAVGASSDSAADLLPGDLATLRGGTSFALEHGVATERFLGWTEDKLAFRGVPLRRVLTELGRWYNLEFVVTDSALASREVVADFTGKRVSRETLTPLAATLDAHYTWSGRTITFSPSTRARVRAR